MKKISIVLLVAVFLFGCSTKLNVEIKENVKSEYGEELDDRVLFDENNSDNGVGVKKVSDFDKFKIGEQEITVTFSNGEIEKDEKMKVVVEDTKKPIIQLEKAKLTIMQGDKLDLSNNIKYVKDEVDGNLKYSTKKIDKDGYYIDKGKLNTNKKGTYKVDVIAIDKNGNETKKAFDVIVEDKKKSKKTKQDDTNKVVNSNSSSQSSNSNSSSNNVHSGNMPSSKPNNKPSSKPSKPNKPHIHDFGYTGHSDAVFVGPVFNSIDDALEWGDNYDNPDWSGWGWSATMCSCGKWRMYCFNIRYPE